MSGRPKVTEIQVRQTASRLLGVAIETIIGVRQLESFEDCNYHIKINNKENDCNDQFILKILNLQSNLIKDAIECKILACQFLSQSGIQCSKPVQLTNGSYMDMVTFLSSDSAENTVHNDHIVFIVEYLQGILLRDMEPKFDNTLMYQLGQTIATMDKQLLKFQSHQRKFFTGDWSLHDNFATLDRYLQYIHMASKKDILTEIFQSCKIAMQQILPQLKTCFIHGDVNPGNVIVSTSSSKSTSVSQVGSSHQGIGVIDFGDFHYSYLIIELAIAIAHVMAETTTDAIANSGHLLAGYLSVVHLNPKEFNLLYDVILARLFQLIVLSEYVYTLDSSNSYVIDRVPNYYQAITMLWKLSREEAYQRWHDIIQSY
ncbi:Hydroxylysine kinase [Trichoplax sp. H2]|nr:Hydroxylysine kinase [Trichoplax sp. H2]|eukprot:RDD45789.1 Hydroxylysine kinase [Trichoplax sp. H2]